MTGAAEEGSVPGSESVAVKFARKPPLFEEAVFVDGLTRSAKKLPSALRAMFHRMRLGGTQREMACDLGISRSTLNARRKRLARRFERLGLRGYLGRTIRGQRR